MRALKWLLICTILLAPVVFVISLHLLTVLGHGHTTPSRVLWELWFQSVQGDEDLFVLTGLVFWTVSWSYFLAALVTIRKLAWSTLLPLVFVVMSFLTPYGAALEKLWRPHVALGNCLAAALWTTIFVGAWVFYFKRLAAELRRAEDRKPKRMYTVCIGIVALTAVLLLLLVWKDRRNVLRIDQSGIEVEYGQEILEAVAKDMSDHPSETADEIPFDGAFQSGKKLVWNARYVASSKPCSHMLQKDAKNWRAILLRHASVESGHPVVWFLVINLHFGPKNAGAVAFSEADIPDNMDGFIAWTRRRPDPSNYRKLHNAAIRITELTPTRMRGTLKLTFIGKYQEYGDIPSHGITVVIGEFDIPRAQKDILEPRIDP